VAVIGGFGNLYGAVLAAAVCRRRGNGWRGATFHRTSAMSFSFLIMVDSVRGPQGLFGESKVSGYEIP